MRTFLAGAACGALLCAAVFWLRNEQFSEEAVRAVTPSECSGISSDSEEDNSASAQVVADDVAGDHDECVVLNDSNLDRIMSMISRHRLEQQGGSLESEPKDPLWSAAMEQQIRSAVGTHRLASQFTIASVDCRTVYCMIKAEVPPGDRAPLAVEAFGNVVRDVASDFGLHAGGAGSGSFLPSGMIDAHALLRRFKIGDECPAGFKECWNR
jgi:hypothetical protein